MLYIALYRDAPSPHEPNEEGDFRSGRSQRAAVLCHCSPQSQQLTTAKDAKDAEDPTGLPSRP